jgi:glutamate 5-kinase
MAQRWVVKAGSNMVCTGGPLLVRAWMHQLAHLRRKHHIEVIWVTSGAIASAVERTHFKKQKRTLAQKQALSAIGQPLVMDVYNLALQTSGMLGAQVLLTYDDLANAKRRKNFSNTIEQLLDWGVTPILNENDAVATEEIRFGDNDSLSAKVARTMKADRLVILTDVEGLYDSDPRRNPTACLIPSLDGINAKTLALAGVGAGTSRGTGGMLSKLTAAKEGGIETWLVKGDISHVLERVAENEIVGTRIRARR